MTKISNHGGFINSQINETVEEREQVVNSYNHGQCDVLFITPEPVSQKEDFIQLLSQLKVGLFFVDEAHCISDWGHDFVRIIGVFISFFKFLQENIAVLATTATANERVIADVANQLGDCGRSSWRFTKRISPST